MTDSRVGGYAIVGIGCRFPGGVHSPEDFWRLLAEGRDAIGPVPEDRPDWGALYDPDPAATGRIYARLGGFIDDIDAFDAGFFGISPREAVHIDPQHRFLLEAVWHAFEDARIPLHGLAGSDTAVYVGISTHDYGDVQMDPRFHDRIALHTNTGCATSIAANRVSFTYDLRGPSMSVDTACSSALTALHLACNALDAGDCSMAVVAGVQLLLRPELTMGFCRATMLSVDGRCKAFDAAGNGYVRSEGVGAVVLKPLAAAIADGDPIHAVVLGSSANQDGRTSSLTVPSEDSQRAMLKAALSRAGVDPARVQYVEAHGPGTAVGDPIEARAIGSVFAPGRPDDQPLLVGSVKTNIGHLEAGSGVAGLIKAALALANRQVPPSLHFHEWNPAIDPHALKLRVPTTLEEWPDDGAPPTVAVNSFGFGGSNASVVLGAAPVRQPPPAPEVARAEILPISAQSPDALRKLALASSELALAGTVPLAALCGAAALGRSHLDERIAIVASDLDGLADGLDAAVAGDNAANIAHGHRSGGAGGKTAFVFSGMGPQWWAMGRELLDREPVFAAMMDRCDAALRPHSGWSLIDEFRADEADSRIAHPTLAQVSNFALQMSLVALWRHWGIEPQAVIGHSGGAMAAACVAGIHTLDDAIWLSFHRSRMQGRDSNAGEMLAIGLPADEVEALIRGHEDSISIAAINGPRTVTVSGDGAVLRPLAAALAERKVFARTLAVTIAYHSPRMDPIREEFLETVKDLRASSASLPFVSDTTGTWEDGGACDAQYWWRAIRSPVRFADSIHTLAAAGFGAFVEVSPHPVLAASINECMRDTGGNGVVVPSLRRNEDERTTMLRSLATLYVNGASPTWDALYARDVSVPLALYPFERQRHWFDPDEGGVRETAGVADPNPLLGQRIPGAQPLWETRLDQPALGWIDDHVVQDQVVVPGASHVAMALAAARRLTPDGPIVLRDITFQRPLVPGESRPRAQVALDGDGRSVALFSHADSKTGWTRHAEARIGTGAIGIPAPLDRAAIAARLGPPQDVAAFYAAVARRGLVYGPSFRGITAVRATRNEALVTVGPVEGLTPDPDSIHPCLLDAAFQALIAIADISLRDDNRTFLPVGIDEVRLYRPAGGRFHVHCRLDALEAASARTSLDIIDDDGAVLLSVIRLTARLVSSGAGDGDVAAQCFYEFGWEPKALTTAGAPPRRTGLLRLDPGFDATMTEVGAAAEAQTGWSHYYREAETPLTDAAAAHLLAAFAELGITVTRGTLLDPAALARIRENEPSGGRWTKRLLGLLQDAGCIAPDQDGWRVVRIPDVAGLPDRLPAHRIDLALLDQAGRTLAGALSGATAGRDAIFTADSLPLLTSFYRDAPGSDHYNRVLAGALAALAARASAGGQLRVLEVGAGTGGATAAVLGVLPHERTHYVFTDAAAVLLDGAQALFGDVDCVEIRPFDIGRDPQAQGFQPGSFDLIVAANVVHATPDVAATLDTLRALLIPGGTLAMIEITRHPPWLDVIFGQTRGWWAFTDCELRPEHPLLEGAQWSDVLEGAGFEHVTLSREPHAIGEAAQTVILAGRPPETAASRPWLLLGDGDVPQRLAATIAAVGGRALVEADEAAVDHHLDADAVSGIIDLRALAPRDGGSAVSDALSLARRLVTRAEQPSVPIWFVTAGGAQPGGGIADQAPVIGFGRTLIKEHAEIALRMADLGTDASDAAIAAFVREITEHDRDEEIAFVGPSRYVRRLRREEAGAATRSLDEQVLEWSAEVGTAGSLASLRLRAFRPAPLGPREVRIKVKAASLNFRDIVLAMGRTRGLEEGDSSTGRGRLGSDCAGTVVEVGSDITRFRPGDAVMAMAPASLSSMAITDESCVAHKPARLSFAEAAALPTVAITAWQGLRDLGRIARGDKVLIHSAAGGVGLAAIQVARDAGAEIFATAGSEAKRDYLRALGITHVMDSRTLDFADAVGVATGGTGVDIVLNSLSGEAIARGMACLAPYGRFVEIGKADIYANTALPLGDFKRGLSFVSFDLDRMTTDHREAVSAVLGDIVDAIEEGRFAPLPVETFPMSRIEDAFREMALGRQIGKIVLVNDGTRPALPVRQGIDCQLRADASYLITGGLGGFGLTVAEHLAEGLPGAIVLMGRNPPSEKAHARIGAIRARGVRVEVMQGDVIQVADVARVLGRIAAELPPLKGLFHGAMVLDDQRVATMDDAAMARVMAPKATGAMNLHEATAELALDHFVLFSSITSVLGNPLQANYAAANAYLDALAHQRQAAGLPALTINWGVLAGSGYVADRPELQRFLDQQGYLSFSPRQALEAFDTLLTRASPQIMAARIDWGAMASYSARSAASPRLADLIPAAGEQPGNAAAGSEILAALAATPADEQAPVIEAFLIRSVARILGAAPDTIDAERTLDNFGLDSLLSVEFLVVLSGDLGFEIPVMALLDDMTIRKLGGLILTDLAGRAGIAAAPSAPRPGPVDTVQETLSVQETLPPPPVGTAAGPEATVIVATGPATTQPATTPEPLPWPSTQWTPLQKSARAVSRVGLAALGTVDVTGLELLPEGPFILAVNHLSMADVPLALSVIPRRTTILATDALQRYWVLDQIVGRLGESIYLPKGGDVAPALERALGVLRAGGIIALAPEGKRNRAGLGRAETGIAWLAAQSGLPVVPYAAWGQELWRDRFRRLGRLALSVRIGEPIAPPAGDTGARRYADLVMCRIAELLPPRYRGAYAELVVAD